MIELPARVIPNCCLYAELNFAPEARSAGREYFISLSTKGLIFPDAVTVFLSVWTSTPEVSS